MLAFSKMVDVCSDAAVQFAPDLLGVPPPNETATPSPPEASNADDTCVATRSASPWTTVFTVTGVASSLNWLVAVPVHRSKVCSMPLKSPGSIDSVVVAGAVRVVRTGGEAGPAGCSFCPP